MKAVKFWSSASDEEKKISGYPPGDLIKDVISFNDEAASERFAALGYQVMTDEEYEQYISNVTQQYSSFFDTTMRQIQIEMDGIEKNEERIKKGREILLLFKLKNITEGIKWYQAVHLHERLRSWKVTLPPQLGGDVKHVDLMNMILAGDIETACLCIMFGENDDMTKPYHWVTEERRQWVITQMKQWLGWQ